MDVLALTDEDSCGKPGATMLATCGGGSGRVGEGASRFSIDSTASSLDRLRRVVRRRRNVEVIRFMSDVSLWGTSGRRDVRRPNMTTARRGGLSTSVTFPAAVFSLDAV
jgi:hypothetical protein